MADNKQYNIHFLSNSHWDREWYMSHEKYLARLVPLMDRLVNIMKTQPDYIFVMDGQYAMLEDYLAIRPEVTESIKAWMAEGRLKEAWRGFKSEVKKIVWPSWKQVLKNTFVVLVIVVICAVIIGALDYAFSQGIIGLTKLFT